MMRFLIAAVFVLAVSGCGGDPEKQYENYNLQNSSSLTLTALNHPHGYEKSSCFACHLEQNIHQVDRIGDPSFQFARTLVEQNGLSSCAGCHGKNGVNP